MRGRNNAFVRRQRPGDEYRTNSYGVTILECIHTCESVPGRCTLPLCQCSAADNDHLVGCINSDCGRTASNNYRADIIAQCPRAFDYNRVPGENATQRTTSKRTSTPTPTPKPASTPVQANSTTRTSSTSPKPTSKTTAQSTRIASAASQQKEESSQPVYEASDPAKSTDVTESSAALAKPSQTVSSGAISSTNTLLSENAQTESLNPGASAESQSLQPSGNGISDEELQSARADDAAASSISHERSINAASATAQVSAGLPILGPLDPSSPGKLSNLNAGVIAGIIVGIMAVITIFLALWYRSYRRRQRENLQSYQISSPMPTTHDDTTVAEAWMQFGGAKGSMISSTLEEESEKNAPIYNMFSKRALPSSPMMSSLHRDLSIKSPTQPTFPHTVRRASGKGMLSSVKTKWMDGMRSPPPAYPYGCSSEENLISVYKRPAGTSFFARLLGNPIERKPAQPVYQGPKLPHPHFNADEQTGNKALQTLPEEEEPRQSECLDTNIEARYRYTTDYGNGNELLAPLPSPMFARKTPADSVYEEQSATSFGRPSIAWSARSGHRDMSVFDDGEEPHDMRATSTRAPSLDLAWVTQGGDTRIPVPSWAAPRKRPSMRSKKSSKSVSHNRSTFRQSVMSMMSTSSSSAAPSRSNHTSSSGHSRSAHSSTGPLSDMPAFSSIPSFSLEIGSDKAKAVLQLLVNTPTTPAPPIANTEGNKADDLCKDESRPVSVVDHSCFTPKSRDSASSLL